MSLIAPNVNRLKIFQLKEKKRMLDWIKYNIQLCGTSKKYLLKNYREVESKGIKKYT